MIKFFRKFRQGLLTENKISKYLLYAIGEIVLVVIGILLALSINNWNSKQIDSKEAQEFSSRLLREIDQNIKSIEIESENLKGQSSNIKKLLELIGENSETVKVRELDSLMYKTLGNINADFTLGTLNEGLGKGSISLIKSDSLRTTLYDLTSKFDKMIVYENINNTDLNDYFVPFLYDNYSLRNIDNKFSEFKDVIGDSKLYHDEYLDILQNKSFENRIDNRFYNINYSLLKYNELKNHLNKVKNLLKTEIEK